LRGGISQLLGNQIFRGLLRSSSVSGSLSSSAIRNILRSLRSSRASSLFRSG